jgi:hypothetical protein
MVIEALGFGDDERGFRHGTYGANPRAGSPTSCPTVGSKANRSLWIETPIKNHHTTGHPRSWRTNFHDEIASLVSMGSAVKSKMAVGGWAGWDEARVRDGGMGWNVLERVYPSVGTEGFHGRMTDSRRTCHSIPWGKPRESSNLSPPTRVSFIRLTAR